MLGVVVFVGCSCGAMCSLVFIFTFDDALCGYPSVGAHRVTSIIVMSFVVVVLLFMLAIVDFLVFFSFLFSISFLCLWPEPECLRG